MKIVLQLKDNGMDKAKAKSEKAAVGDLGCGACFLDQGGSLRKVKELPLKERENIWDSKPCISESFFRKKISKYSYSGLATIIPQIDPQTVEPMDVFLALNSTALGREIVKSVHENKCLSYAHEAQMMNALCDTFEKSSNKNSTMTSSISIAKGIVKAFPDLADMADCVWQSWYYLALRKFSTVSSKSVSNTPCPSYQTELEKDSDLMQTDCSLLSWTRADQEALSEATSSVDIPMNSKRKRNVDARPLLETTTSRPSLRLRLVRSKDDLNSWEACPPNPL